MNLTNNEAENLINYIVGKVILGLCVAGVLASVVFFGAYHGATYFVNYLQPYLTSLF